jgi:hypothetical protein
VVDGGSLLQLLLRSSWFHGCFGALNTTRGPILVMS